MRLFSLSGQRPPTLGVTNGRLSPCPARPNCVSSDADDPDRRVAPFALSQEPYSAWEQVRTEVEKIPRTAIVARTDAYLHAECRSTLFGFVDDLELHLRPAESLIAVRSAARLGHSDFGVNRRRIERLRVGLQRLGVIR